MWFLLGGWRRVVVFFWLARINSGVRNDFAIEFAAGLVYPYVSIAELQRVV
jgi:hypothetical protein